MKNVLLNDVYTVSSKIIFYCMIILLLFVLVIGLSVSGISVALEHYELIDIVIGFVLVFAFDIVPILLLILCVKRIKYLKGVLSFIAYIESKVSNSASVIDVGEFRTTCEISEKDVQKIISRVSKKLSDCYSLNDMKLYKKG